MKRLLSIAFFISAVCAQATEHSTVSSLIESRIAEKSHSANIMQGDIEFNSFLALLSTYEGGSHYTSFNLLFSSEYFFWDHLSLGAELVHYTTRGYTETRVGPSGKYYLFEQERFAPFVGEAILYNHTSVGAGYWTNQLSFGFKYFLIPSLAVANSLNWYHLFGRSAPDAYATLNRISIEMGLSIHL